MEKLIGAGPRPASPDGHKFETLPLQNDEELQRSLHSSGCSTHSIARQVMERSMDVVTALLVTSSALVLIRSTEYLLEQQRMHLSAMKALLEAFAVPCEPDIMASRG